MVRRLVAGGAGILVLVLLILLIKGCRDSAREQAFRDYFGEVEGLVERSNSVSKAVFGTFAEPKGQSPIELGTNINARRSEADSIVEQAKDVDHPDELDRAHEYLVTVLTLRRDGIAGVAEQLPTALSDAGQEEATARIAVYMRNFLASDVLYTERVVPNLRRPAEREQLGNLSIPKSHFLPELAWLSPGEVGERIGQIRGGGSAGPAAPGLHGTGLGTVTVKPGGQTLQEGVAVDLPASPNLSFDVQVMNQGEHDETDVEVEVTVSGSGKPIGVTQEIPTIAAAETKTVSIPLAAEPPTGEGLSVKVQVHGVPGEKNLDNNTAEYSVVFTS
jgi:hypothetical protein